MSLAAAVAADVCTVENSAVVNIPQDNVNSAPTNGPRVSHFRLALHKMMQATIKSCGRMEKTEECFPFGLSTEQMIQLDSVLAAEMGGMAEDIERKIESLLVEHDLISKLNEVDSFMKQLRQMALVEAATDPETATSGITTVSAVSNTTHSTAISTTAAVEPEKQVQAMLMPLRRAAVEELTSSIKELKALNEAKRVDLDSRRSAMLRRCDLVRDKQMLYDNAFAQILSLGDTKQLESLVARMAHQN